MTTKSEPTPEEALAAARKLVAEADAKAAAEARAEADKRAADLAPLREIVDSPEFASLSDRVRGQQPSFSDDSQIGPHLVAIIVGMANLRQALDVLAPPSSTPTA